MHELCFIYTSFKSCLLAAFDSSISDKMLFVCVCRLTGDINI